MNTSSSSNRSAICITLSMPMHCYGISRGRLTTRRSAGNSKNSVLKTRYAHISGKAERDGWQRDTAFWNEDEDVYCLNERGG